MLVVDIATFNSSLGLLSSEFEKISILLITPLALIAPSPVDASNCTSFKRKSSNDCPNNRPEATPDPWINIPSPIISDTQSIELNCDVKSISILLWPSMSLTRPLN